MADTKTCDICGASSFDGEEYNPDEFYRCGECKFDVCESCVKTPGKCPDCDGEILSDDEIGNLVEVMDATASKLAELERKAAAWDEVCHKVDLCMQNDVTGYAVVQLVKLFREQEARDA